MTNIVRQIEEKNGIKGTDRQRHIYYIFVYIFEYELNSWMRYALIHTTKAKAPQVKGHHHSQLSAQ